MIEYSMAFLTQHPWPAAIVGLVALVFLLLPRQCNVTYSGNRTLVVYDSPLLCFERRWDAGRCGCRS